MPALTQPATTTPDKNSRRILDDSGRRQLGVNIVLGDGTSTYPANGIPLASDQAMGFSRKMEELDIQSSDQNGVTYTWDNVNKKILCWHGATSNGGKATQFTAGTVITTAQTLFCICTGK